jgi:hypothetical protein
MNLLEKLTQAMVDTSNTLVGCHEVAKIDPNDKAKEAKLDKIHQELGSTLNSFRDRFALVLGDMKYLTNDSPSQNRIKQMTSNLKSTAPRSYIPVGK